MSSARAHLFAAALAALAAACDDQALSVADGAPESNRTGDRMSDVLWENTVTHRFALWLMSETDVLVAGPEIPEPSGP